jgi:hypothetical protein
MKTFLALSLLSTLTVQASDCSVYVANEGYNYGGWVIQMDFTPMLQAKNYQRSDDPAAAYSVVWDVQMVQRKHFEFAEVTYSLVDDKNHKNVVDVKKSKRCYTTNCAVSDVRSVLNAGMRELKNKLPACL